MLRSIPDDAALSDGVPEARRGEHETLTPQAATRLRGGEGGKRGQGKGRGRAVSRRNRELVILLLHKYHPGGGLSRTIVCSNTTFS